jgi:hypothetical protein
MSELRRWSEEGATPDELSLLDASRAERAPAPARSRAFKVLGLAVGVTTTTTATATASSAVLGTWTKLMGISVLVGGVAALGVAYEAKRAASPPPPRPAVEATAVAAPPAQPPSTDMPANVPAETTASAIAVPAASPPPRLATALRAPRTASSDERLSQEVAALERANQALAAHQPDIALQALDRYAAEFPRGALSSDATVLRVRALLARGDRASAQRLASAYSAAHPDSPFARRLEALVRDKATE